MSENHRVALDKLAVIAAFLAVVMSVISLVIAWHQNNDNKQILISEVRANQCLSLAKYHNERSQSIQQFMILTDSQTQNYQDSVNEHQRLSAAYKNAATEIVKCLRDKDDKTLCKSKNLIEEFDDC